ncbi:MAG TPA: hypothetical protein VIT38_07595 [Allosphingosinicella sp.]
MAGAAILTLMASAANSANFGLSPDFELSSAPPPLAGSAIAGAAATSASFGLSPEFALSSAPEPLAATVLAAAVQETPPPSSGEPAATPPATTPPAEEPESTEMPVPPSEESLIPGRERPDIRHDLPDPVTQVNPGAVRQPPPEAFPADHVAIPDRWRLAETLGLVRTRWWDPYHQNTLKGDRPLCLSTEEEQARRRAAGTRPCATPRFLGLREPNWFFVASAISDTVIEPRSFPIPGGVQTTGNPDNNDVFGRDNSTVYAQTFIFSAALIKGSTTFEPALIEYRATIAVQANYVDVPERRVLDVRPTQGSNRFDYAVGVQELFFDYDFGPTSYRFDFRSIRIGIQDFQLDFRGFLFQDQNLGVRLFGNRDNNRFQFNVIGIWRLEKDTNSGLNNIFQTPRDDWILHANLFRQDFPFVGLTSELSVTWNINRERDEVEVDDNGFPVRPALFGNLRSRSYDAFYIGYGVDGHIGRLNLTAQTYALFGQDRVNVFNGRNARIRGWFAALEPSFDFNWIRVRGSALYASGDDDPFDSVEGGFDSIVENPIFAGADTSYWIRQTIPFAGGARAVSLNSRNGVLVDLRSSKEQGQSNFVNPGTMLLGVGADFDITPRLRVSTNVNHLWMENTTVIQRLRQQGTVRRDIGWDLSAAIIYRPANVQNIVFRLSGALLQPGQGFNDLFTNVPRDDRYYSILFNALLTY